MANTNYLKKVAEREVRIKLEDAFRVPFTSERLVLSTGGDHEFDAVSQDKQVVCSIKTHSGITSGGKNPAAKVQSAVAELYYLSLVDAPTRVLVLTDPQFYSIMKSQIEDKRRLAPGIRLQLMVLPAHIQVQIRSVQDQASREMGTSRV